MTKTDYWCLMILMTLLAVILNLHMNADTKAVIHAIEMHH